MEAVGTWDPIGIDEVVERFAPFDVDWWVAGGQAIDLFLGWETRAHEDLDLEMFRTDQAVLHEVFAGWELYTASQGSLDRWLPGDPISPPVFGIWGRPGPDAPWGVEVILASGDGTEWRFRRDERIVLARDRLTRTTPTGIRFCTPEVQLLYKAKQARAKDDTDLAHCLHRLGDLQIRWLRDAISLLDADHPWVGVLEHAGRRSDPQGQRV